MDTRTTAVGQRGGERGRQEKLTKLIPVVDAPGAVVVQGAMEGSAAEGVDVVLLLLFDMNDFVDEPVCVF